MRGRYSSALIFVGAMALSAPSFAASCVTATFTDGKGVPIKLEKPYVAMMIGGRPITDGMAIPQGQATIKAIACPPELVKKIEELFQASCGTEAARQKAAADSNASIENVTKGCAEMSVALTSKPQP
jgi:hypothetical protein